MYNSDLENDRQEPNYETEPEDAHQPGNLNISNKSTSPCSLPPTGGGGPIANSTQIQALQEEILHLRAQVALLQSQLAQNCGNTHDHDNDEDDDNDDELHEEKSNYTSDDLCETADIFDVEATKELVEAAPQVKVARSPAVPKVAERVKLRRTVEEKHITGTDITSSGHFSTEMAEHMVSDMMLAPVSPDIVASSRLQSEVQRLQKKIEHLKVQNSVLTLTLAESKEHCDHLFLLCGKFHF